jgi:hypothetical protein
MRGVHERFTRWRESHTGRLPIPESLWTAAAEVARVHGVFRTAKVLRLEYGKLKRLAAASSAVRSIRGVAGIRGGRRSRVSDRVGRAAGQDAHPVEGRHGGRLGRIQPGMVGVGVIQVAPQMRILVASRPSI